MAFEPDPAACERIGAKIAVALSSHSSETNWPATFRILANGIRDLFEPATPLELSALAELDALSVRTINELERELDAVYVADLADQTEDIRRRLGRQAIEEIRAAFASPAPPELENENMAKTPPHKADCQMNIVEVIAQAGPDDVAAIDAEIKRLREVIDKLKRARSILTPNTRETKGRVADRICEYMKRESVGVIDVQDLASALDLKCQAVRMAATRSELLTVTPGGRVAFGDDPAQALNDKRQKK